MAQLGAEYSILKTKAEKQRWIEENKSQFNALGFEIADVTDAENVFVKNTAAVVNALIARAVAAKKAEQAAQDLVDLEKKRKQESRQFDEGSNTSKTGDYYRKFKRGHALSDEEAKAAGVRTKAERKRTDNSMTAMYQAQYTGGNRTYYDQLTDEEIRKVNEYRNKEALAAKKAVEARYKAEEDAIKKGVADAVKAQYDADAKLYKIVKRPKKKPTGGSGGSKKDSQETPEAGSLADLQKQREKLQAIQKNATYKKHKTNADEVEREIRRLDQLIADEQFVIDFNTDPAKVSLQTVETQFNKMYARMRNQNLSAPEM